MGAIGAGPGGAACPTSPADAAPRHTLTLTAGAEPDWLALPDFPGVAIFEAADGRALLIATTASLRGLCRRRLGSTDAAPPGASDNRPSTDYRAITASVVAIEAGSALEADLIYLHEARVRMPLTHQSVSERWRAWFVHIDPDADHPQWSKTNLLGLVKPRSAGTPVAGPDPEARSVSPASGVLIGPIADKDAAGRLIDRTIDAFDLCRYHHLLVLAPRAAPCPYKEMDRCPAPCDGTESLPSYRDRVRAAIDFLCGQSNALLDQTDLLMRAAGTAGNFEHAAALKQRLARLRSLASGGSAPLARLDDWRQVILLPDRRSRTPAVRLLILAAGRVGVLGGCAAGDAHALLTLARAAIDASGPPALILPTDEQIDTIAAVSRWMHTPKSRKRGQAVAILRDDDAASLASRLSAAALSVSRHRPKGLDVEERGLAVLDQPASASRPDGTTCGESGPESGT